MAKAKVAIVQDFNIDQAMEAALCPLDLNPIIQGKLVAIKPNETWASKDDLTAITQADTVRALIRQLKKCEPRQLILSGGAGAAETEDVLRLAGIMDVLDEEGVEFFDHNRPPFEEVALEYSPEKDVDGPQKSVMVNPRVLEYDTLISLAQLKVHATATVTLCLKNIAMSYPAADYYGHPRHEEKHANHFFDDMHSFIAAMAKRFPAKLGIIVGHPAMLGLGPIGGHAVETGMVIASRDQVAADVVGAHLLGFSPQGVRHLWEAGRLEIGETDPDNMEFPCLGLEEAFESFTKAVYGRPLSRG